MFALLRRLGRKPVPAYSRRTRLSLEALESRYCLSAPSLTLSAQTSPGHVANLSGSLMPNPDGHSGGVADRTICFSGAATGSTITDGQGHYTYYTTTATLGQVTASGSDDAGNQANTAPAFIYVASPQVTLNLSYGTQGNIILSGYVTDLDPANRTVTLSGAVNTSVVTQSGGSFSLTVKPSQFGAISATTTDLWGLTSNTPTVQFNPDFPTISNFKATPSWGNLWTFTGMVSSPEAPGLVVHIGGFPSLNAQATVQQDHSFTVSTYIAAGQSGVATANTTDWWGEQSNQATYYIN